MLRTAALLDINDIMLFLPANFHKQPPEELYAKNVLTNFTKFTGKHLCKSLFFNKVTGLRPATSLKKRLWHRCFSVNFAEFLRTPFITEHLWCLFLEIQIKSLEILFNPLQHGVAFLYPLKTSENY